jgi:hypothetical protein
VFTTVTLVVSDLSVVEQAGLLCSLVGCRRGAGCVGLAVLCQCLAGVDH